MNASRRRFVQGVGIFGALFLGRGLAACAVPAEEAVGENDEALATCGDARIARNHGHALTVPSEDVGVGVAKTYSIKGTSGHDHRVTITAEHFAMLATGVSVAVDSTTDAGHAHAVTVTCAIAPRADAGSTDGGRTSPTSRAALPSASTRRTWAVTRTP